MAKKIPGSAATDPAGCTNEVLADPLHLLNRYNIVKRM